jgi:hypothetical protein
MTNHIHLVPRSKNEWSYTSTPPVSFNGVVLSLKKAQGQLYLFFTGYAPGEHVTVGHRSFKVEDADHDTRTDISLNYCNLFTAWKLKAHSVVM